MEPEPEPGRRRSWGRGQPWAGGETGVEPELGLERSWGSNWGLSWDKAGAGARAGAGTELKLDLEVELDLDLGLGRELGWS